MKCRGAIIYYNYVQAISPDYKEIFLLIAASLIAQLVKNPPAIQEIPVWFLGQEDLLEKG